MRINERLQEAAQAIDELFADDQAEVATRYQRLLAALQNSENVPPSAINVDSPAPSAPQPASPRSAPATAPQQDPTEPPGERVEVRRGERVTRLIDFLSAVQEAERVAVDRYHHGESDEQWQARAKQSIDRMWVAQKTIHMLCGSEVNDAARLLAYDVQNVIRNGPAPGEPRDEMVWAYIRPNRRAFLDLVRDHLE